MEQIMPNAFSCNEWNKDKNRFSGIRESLDKGWHVPAKTESPSFFRFSLTILNYSTNLTPLLKSH